jgi:hypothetical protein
VIHDVSLIYASLVHAPEPHGLSYGSNLRGALNFL